MKRLSISLVERLERVKSAASVVEDIETCPVCYETELKEGAETTIKLGCSHMFCRDCLFEDFKLKVNSNKLDELICPQALCGKHVTAEEIARVIGQDSDTANKFRQFQADAQVDKDPLLRWCTKPGCKGTAQAKSLDDSVVSCS